MAVPAEILRAERIVYDAMPADYVEMAHIDRGGRDLGWTARARVPRMGKRGQLLGRGSEEVIGQGDTPEEAARSLVEFYEYRREGKI